MAEDEIKVKKERDPIMMVCFVVFLLTVCAITGATVYNNYLKADDTIAVEGSNVSVNYIGTYYSQNGTSTAVIFDTSYWNVANDDNKVKSNDFTLKTESSYKPLSFAVGGTSVLTGFGNAVIGHKVGDRIHVVLPSGEGYNAQTTYTTISASDVKTVPATETLTAAQFESLYGFALKGLKEIEKTVYGWPATASYNSSSNTVTMSYHPAVNTSYTAVDGDFGTVALRVTAVGANISFTYSVSGYTKVSGAGDIQMIMVDFGTEKFYITAVTDGGYSTASSFTCRNVDERYNQDLYFEIEIVSIG